MNFSEILESVRNAIWGPPLLILIIVSGIYLTIRLRGVQFRHLWYAHKLAFTRYDDDSAQGDITHFQSLMTALAGTIGIGSITGVATAITAGGLGAIFWMWVSATFGMATKYTEAILAVKYRVVDEHNEMCGGPMYYLERGAKSRFLGVMFAVFGALTALGTGNMVQANSVAAAAKDLLGVDPLWTAIFLLILTGLPLIWGIKSISKIVGVLVPVMAGFYIIGGFFILLVNYAAIPQAMGLILSSAFSGQAAVGGFLGASVAQAVQMGFARGIFSSEAGLGTSPIAAAAAKTDSPGRQALVSMSSVFITTGIVCTITGLIIATTQSLGLKDEAGNLLNGSTLAITAFNKVIPGGGLIITIALIPFAYSTILSWAYYGEKCLEYLWGIHAVPFYRVLFSFVVIPGCLLKLQIVWQLADILNGLMAFPNLIGLLLLAHVASQETKLFEKLLASEKHS